MSEKINIPRKLLLPIKTFLEIELMKLKKMVKKIKRSDPFSNTDRDGENSLEEDLEEQVGHFDSQVKLNFLKKQMIQLRKTLSMIKIGRYGVCDKCGKMIDTDRLAAKPDATICIKCEEEREK
jgi:DnaK suppressor protein